MDRIRLAYVGWILVWLYGGLGLVWASPGGFRLGGEDFRKCRAGCAAVEYRFAEFSRKDFEEQIRLYQRSSSRTESLALDRLLFYGKESRWFLGRGRLRGLDREKELLLRRELRKVPYISLRLVDEGGKRHMILLKRRVHWKKKMHIDVLGGRWFSRADLNGRVYRVGYGYVWARY